MKTTYLPFVAACLVISSSAGASQIGPESFSKSLRTAICSYDPEVSFAINNMPVSYRAGTSPADYGDEESRFLYAVQKARSSGKQRLHADALNSAGVFYYRNRYFEKSLRMFYQALKIACRTGPDTYITDCLGLTAQAARACSQHLLAEQLYKEILQRRMDKDGPLSPGVADTYMSLAYLYYDMCDVDRALMAEKKAHDISAGRNVTGSELEPVYNPAQLEPRPAPLGFCHSAAWRNIRAFAEKLSEQPLLTPHDL